VSSDSSAALHDAIRARDGALCIYTEKRWIAHVKLSILTLTDRSVHFRLDALPTPGFTPPEPTWEAGVAFTEGSFGSDFWMGSIWLRWTICFDPEAISALIAIAHAVEDRPPDERSYALWTRFGALLHAPQHERSS
jgi:hypothetical protein